MNDAFEQFWQIKTMEWHWFLRHWDIGLVFFLICIGILALIQDTR